MLGLLGFVLLNANKLSNHVKENLGFSIIIKDGVKEVDIIKLQKSLDARVDMQYYVDRVVDQETRTMMVQKASEFHLRCQEIISKITRQEIQKIRDTLE